jgi:thymidylate synthase
MEHQYHQLLEDILNHGEKTEDRTGVGTLSIFGYQMRFNLQDGFPAVTTKKLAWKACAAELLWFLEGSTDERRLAELTYAKDRTELVGRNTIWTANADAQGKDLGYVNNEFTKELGPVYGAQWRCFNNPLLLKPETDQIMWLLNEIQTNPDSRRLILSAWNPNQLSQMALPPCHYTAQFSVRGNKLSCMMTQRSGDAFLGIPFNIASYSLLTHIIAKECNLEVGDFVHTIGDAHIYLNHIDQVKEQLSRDPYDLPTLYIDDDFSLQSLLDSPRYKFPLNTVDKFKLMGYVSHNTIKAPMAV